MIKYTVGYQLMANGDTRPSDEGEIITIEATDQNSFALLPDVGDFIHIDNSVDGGERDNLELVVVKTRLFAYTRHTNGDIYCNINIVVSESGVDFDTLIRE